MSWQANHFGAINAIFFDLFGYIYIRSIDNSTIKPSDLSESFFYWFKSVRGGCRMARERVWFVEMGMLTVRDVKA